MEKETINRNVALDRFRGFSTMIMILFQLAENFKSLGFISRIAIHSPNIQAVYLLPNFAIADIGAPLFLLAIGFTYVNSYKKRVLVEGKKSATNHFLKRYLSFIGIGMILDGVNALINQSKNLISLIVIPLSFLSVVLLVFQVISLKVLHKINIYSLFNKTFNILLYVLGILGIIVAATNAFLLCSGKVNYTFGFWLVLHHIGLAGLIVLPFVSINKLNTTTIRFAVGTVLLIIYYIFHETKLPCSLFPNNMILIDVVADGGFLGGFSWAAQLLFFTVFADLYYKNRKDFYKGIVILFVIVVLVLIGIFITLPEITDSWAGIYSSFMPINKGSVSPSYILLTTFISLLVFAFFNLFNYSCKKIDILSCWGKNPMLMYLMEFVFVGGLTTILKNHFNEVGFVVSIVECSLIIIVLTIISYQLNKKQIFLKI